MSDYSINAKVNNSTNQTLTFTSDQNYEGHWKQQPVDILPQSAGNFSVYCDTPLAGSAVQVVYTANDGTVFTVYAQVNVGQDNDTSQSFTPTGAAYQITGTMTNDDNATATFEITST